MLDDINYFNLLLLSLLADDDRNLLDQQPCLSGFISSMCESKTADPIILSFTLKLTGLLAATEKGFSRLDVSQDSERSSLLDNIKDVQYFTL